MTIITCLLANNMMVNAQEVESKIETKLESMQSISDKKADIHLLEELEVQTRGSSAPNSYDSTHDLDISDYNYQISSFGYTVYTDEWLTSDSGEIKVNLYNWTVLENYGGTDDQVTIKLYSNQDGLLVTSTRTVNSYGSISPVTWINISSSKDYYVRFEVPTNGNKYSCNGSIEN